MKIRPPACALIVLALTGLSGCMPGNPMLAGQSTLSEQHVGNWALESEILALPDGKRMASWGDKPFGFLTFDNAGYFPRR